MSCIFTDTLLVCQSAGSFADKLSVPGFITFISSVAENSVLHHCYVVFNTFCCLHTHFSPTQFSCNISVTNLYKLIVSEMGSVYYSSLFFLLQ